MPPIQIPDYVRHNMLRDEQRQNAMLQQSQLKTAGLQQQAMGMANQQTAKEMQDRAELENLLRSTPPEQQERVGLEFLRGRDPDKASKLEATYINRFTQKARIDPAGAASELERATGEKVNIGNRYSEFDVGGGKKAYVDNFTGHIFEPSNAAEIAAVRADFAQKLKEQEIQGRKELETFKSEVSDKKLTKQQEFEAKQKELDRANTLKAAGIRASGTGTVKQLTPAGLEAAARQYAKTGKMPPMGMGGAQGIRQDIINKAAELFPGLDIASSEAGFQANKGSLTALQKNRDAVVAFENTALKNLLQFQRTAKGLIDSGSPLINVPLRQASKTLMGKPEVAVFDAARRVAINEIAKVVSNPNLTGQLSDAARREVESFIPESATISQINAIVEILKTDMANRHQSLDEQLGEIKGRIGGAGKTGGATGSQPKILSIQRVE